MTTYYISERTESVNPTAVLNELEHPSSNQLRRLNPEQYTELQEHWLISGEILVYFTGINALIKFF